MNGFCHEGQRVKPTASERKQLAKKRASRRNKDRQAKQLRSQFYPCHAKDDYQMVPKLKHHYKDQAMDDHFSHCNPGCKKWYEDSDIKSVSLVSTPEHSKEDVLTIWLVDGTTVKIEQQHYFCIDEKTMMCEISGNFACPKCNAQLYCRCKVCGYVPSDVNYRFSMEKIEKKLLSLLDENKEKARRAENARRRRRGSL